MRNGKYVFQLYLASIQSMDRIEWTLLSESRF